LLIPQEGKVRHWMLLKEIFVGFVGLCFGFLSAAGVLTVLLAVGLVPRFAGETHTNKKVFLYEEMVVFGTIIGCILTVFEPYMKFADWMVEGVGIPENVWQIISILILLISGIFSGMFVGSLAVTVAEMLDSIPIFTRRIRFRQGLKALVWSIALGKTFGSLFYFARKIYEVTQ